ncbi:g2657 [Coccomyxa elongata]
MSQVPPGYPGGSPQGGVPPNASAPPMGEKGVGGQQNYTSGYYPPPQYAVPPNQPATPPVYPQQAGYTQPGYPAAYPEGPPPQGQPYQPQPTPQNYPQQT